VVAWRRIGAVVAIIVLAAVFLTAWQRADRERLVETNILALIPEGERLPAVEQAVRIMSERIEQRHILLVKAETEAGAIDATAKSATLMRQSGLYETVDEKADPQAYQDIARFYFPARYHLLSQDIAETIDKGQSAALIDATIRELYRPASAAAAQLENDPFLLFGTFLETLRPNGSGAFKLVDGYLLLLNEGQHYALLTAKLAASPFDIGTQKKVISLKEEIAQSDVTVLYAGVIEHVIAGVVQGQKEMQLVGGISVLGIILLLLVVFRSIVPLLGSLFSIGLGVAVGFATCIAIYGNIHLVTLVAGASLIGISVDYALHFFADIFRAQSSWKVENTLTHVGPGITLGLGTSLIGFAAMFFAPLPGLIQLAIFSASGLLAAYLTVVLFYPVIARGLTVRSCPKGLWHAAESWLSWWCGLNAKIAFMVIGLVIVIGGIVSVQIAPSSDVRLLQKADPQVVEVEHQIKTMTGHNLAPQFFLITGMTAEDVRVKEEALLARLRALPDADRPAGWLAISDFLPSDMRQNENLERVRRLADGDAPVIRQLQDKIGLSDDVVSAFYEKLAHAQPVAFEAWLEADLFPEIASLWLPTLKLEDGSTALGSVVMLNTIRDIGAMRQLAEGSNDILFVDNIADISNIFQEYHGQAQLLLVVAYAVIFVMLAFRYGLMGSAYVLAPPLAAAAVTVIVLYMLGEAYNLFNIVGLVLVLAIGIDYTLFTREARDDSISTMIAILMSAASTMLAFGLLAFSNMPALHSFGLTVLLGIIIALFLAPLAGLRDGEAP